jgi:hypothetical protein
MTGLGFSLSARQRGYELKRAADGTAALLRLVAFPEKRFAIPMGKADLLPENFTSATATCARPRAREPGNQEAAHG